MKLFSYFRRDKGMALSRHGANMTFGQGTLSRSLSQTAVVLKKQLWVWPIIAILILSILGYWVRAAIQRTMRESLASELQTLLNVEVAMLENWVKGQSSNAETLALDARIRTQVYALLKSLGDDAAPAGASDKASPETARGDLRRMLGPALASLDYSGYFVANRKKQALAASSEDQVGRRAARELDDSLERVFDGQTVVCVPYRAAPERDDSAERQLDIPTMYVLTPVRDEGFQIVAALALRIRPEREFTRIMQLGRRGESGETYAFNAAGVLVSNSRFDADMILLGILPDVDNSHSILNLSLRDPGQDITVTGRPRIRRADMPYTKMTESAIAGKSGVDVAGYRDYRGVPVVGAWTWLPKMRLGVATEIDYAEAFQPLHILESAFWVLYVLLAVAALAIFIFSLIVARLRREAQKAAIEAKELGQYHLQEALGAGAMGVVYRGYHAMLRRPTAIKMLHVDKVNEGSIKRFEHEVQITCQLNHPNTIAIYDYGRTPEGVFYYAMEYLDGIDLQKLVEKYGPLPEARAIHLLKQVCGSLYEAHSKGLVHRDVKPSNIMVNRRGGVADVVKVLDFGLVKAMDQEKQNQMSAANGLTGTPLYMSPEAIQSPALVDACSDLYAVGAVGYFLLTGQPVFNPPSIVELLQQHVSAKVVPPSQRLGRPVAEELEHAILACLEKERSKRPQTARMLVQLLERAPVAPWTWEQADAWWGRHERGVNPDQVSATQAPTALLERTIDAAPVPAEE